MISAVSELSFCEVAVTLTLYSPAVVSSAPETVNVTFVEAPAPSETEDRFNDPETSPEVVNRIVSVVLPVFVTLTV